MKLARLTEKIEIIGGGADPDTEITAIATDSRNACPGCMYICIRGMHRDGHDYISSALDAGASCIVSEQAISSLYPSDRILQVKDSRSAAAIIWSCWYGHPDTSMKIAAVTGTNGKTSTAYALYSILRQNGVSTGLIGTVDCILNDVVLSHSGGSSVWDMPSAMTTPDPEELYSLLAVMRDKGAAAVVMEASSHALHQRRLDGMHADVGIFTNLSPEHLDYHGSMEEYFKCKSELMKKCSVGIINIDNEWGRRLAGLNLCPYVKCSAENDPNSDLVAEDVRLTPEGVLFTLIRGNLKAEISYPSCGRFSVYNGMLAAAAAIEMGVSLEKAASALSCVRSASGRLEKISLPGADFKLYIDYAHTPEALKALLSTVREFTPWESRLTVLFGCGGDRDRSKRRIMGSIATTLADHTIITSDNSRTENLERIIFDILTGVPPDADFQVIPDRRKAIFKAVLDAGRGDVIVLAGKGHENYEINSTGKHPFDEREIVREAYALRMGK